MVLLAWLVNHRPVQNVEQSFWSCIYVDINSAQINFANGSVSMNSEIGRNQVAISAETDLCFNFCFLIYSLPCQWTQAT